MRDINIDISVEDTSESFEEETPKRFGFLSKAPFIGRVSYFIFFLTILLTPLFFLPASTGVHLELAKKLFFSGGILISFALWLITRLEDGRLVFPGGAIFWTSFGIIISFFASSLLSTSISASLVGLGHENDTFVSIVLFFIAMFLASTFFESKEKLHMFFLGLTASSSVVGVIELIQIFSPMKLLSGGALTNIIGKWNDVGIFFGLALLLSLVSLELRPFFGSRLKKMFWLLALVSLLILVLVNYDFIWVVTGVFSLVIFIYSLAHAGMFGPKDVPEISDEDGGDDYRPRGIKNIVTRPSFVVVIISVIFFFSSSYVGSMLNKYAIYQLEVRPSWQSTVEVAKVAMQKNLVFGTGPNTFATQWSLSKPDAVNATMFWNTDFTVGFGRVPTMGITLGLFGLITVGLFLLSLVYYGVRALLASFDNLSDHFIVLASFVSAFYLWSFSIFYVTDTVLLVLTFVTTGVFLSSLVRAGLIRNYALSFLNSPRLGFVSVLILVVLIISVISGGYLMARKFNALYIFQQALYNFNQSGNLEQAEASINKAIALDDHDLYYRSLTEVYLIRLKNILGSSSSSQDKQALFRELQTNLSSAAVAARKATEVNADNYLNWLNLGKVGETVLPLKDVIAGSYDLASASYKKALLLNPKNPNIYLSLAQLEATMGNVSQAKAYLAEALAKKSNFTAALFLASQIEASQGNLPAAIAKAEQAAVFAPDDVGILFQVGLLKYMNKDYAGSVSALTLAVAIRSDYSNAKYFLGLSESKLGHTANAMKQFEEIRVLNPDSKEVQTILKNLRAGRGALENITPAPEKRSKPPVKDKGDGTN